MEIKDLAGLSKPLTRLIEVVSAGIGAVARPYLIRRTADAKAHEIRVVADALKEVAQKHQLPVTFTDGAVEVWQHPEDRTLLLGNIPIEDRADSRASYQERKRQANIESITASAASELADESAVPDEAPDDDWISRFFGAAQDVSTAEMQQLWGRILSGEIKRPGTFSLKTLDFVRNMTRSDAELLERLSRFSLTYGGDAVVATPDKSWLKEHKQVYEGHHFALGELGLMYPTSLVYNLFGDNQSQELFVFGETLLIVDRGDLKGGTQLPVWRFTAVGKELRKLASPIADRDYVTHVARSFIKNGCKAAMAPILETMDNGRIRYGVRIEIPGEDMDSTAK